jgi:hypothetical protein
MTVSARFGQVDLVRLKAPRLGTKRAEHIKIVGVICTRYQQIALDEETGELGRTKRVRPPRLTTDAPALPRTYR